MKKINKIIYLVPILVFLIIIFLYLYNRDEKKIYEKSLFYMDTYIYVKIYSSDSKLANKALTEIENIYSLYHKLSDRYNEYEGINNIYFINNNLMSAEYLKIDEKLYDLIEYGIEMYNQSNGKLDISMGNVIDIWKGYRTTKIGIPTIEELEYVNNKSIENIILKNNNLILNNHPNIDLGAIAKGYTTEIVGSYLKSIGINEFLINAGGNVLLGEHYDNKSYKVGLEDPNSSTGEVYKVINVKNMAIVTSGGYERFYEYNNIKYHHIIDPDTLFPTNFMKSVSVITSSSSFGDYLSTTLFLMSVEDGLKYVDTLDDVEAIWYKNDNTTISSKGFSKYE